MTKLRITLLISRMKKQKKKNEKAEYKEIRTVDAGRQWGNIFKILRKRNLNQEFYMWPNYDSNIR